MNDYQIVDMSNNKYFIIGIRLEKGVQSCFYMNKGSGIIEVLITDKDVNSILNNQIIFSIKGLNNLWLEKMIISFIDALKKYSIDITKLKITTEIQNQDLKNILQTILENLKLIPKQEIKLDTKVPEPNVEKIEIKDSFNDVPTEPKKEDIPKEEQTNKENSPILQKESSIKDTPKVSKKKEKESLIKKDSTLDMDMYEGENRLDNNIPKKKNKGKLAIILFILSFILIIISLILFLTK